MSQTSGIEWVITVSERTVLMFCIWALTFSFHRETPSSGQQGVGNEETHFPPEGTLTQGVSMLQ